MFSSRRGGALIQRRAADYDSRIVTIGQLILFSTETGDAWLLDPADRSAARVAREGESEPIHIEETDTTFAIGWKGRFRIEGPAFIYSDEDTGRWWRAAASAAAAGRWVGGRLAVGDGSEGRLGRASAL